MVTLSPDIETPCRTEPCLQLELLYLKVRNIQEYSMQEVRFLDFENHGTRIRSSYVNV